MINYQTTDILYVSDKRIIKLLPHTMNVLNYTPRVPPCLTCLHVERARVPYVSVSLRTFALYATCLHFFTCFTCLHFLRAYILFMYVLMKLT